MGCHYVPQEYLRGFTDPHTPGEIWMFDKKSGRFTHAAVTSVAQEPRYYDAETESLLSREVEGRGHAALNGLRRDRRNLTPDERTWLAVYIATMLMRVPSRRRAATELLPGAVEKTINEVTRVIDEWALNPTADPALVARRRQEVERARLRALADPPDAVVEQIRSPWPSANVLAAVHQMTWRVLASTGPQYFLTSDNPAFFFAAYGIGRPESEITFALCTELALVASWQGEKGMTIFLTGKQRTIREVNRRMVAGAERFVFSHERPSWIEAVASKENPYLSRISW